MTWKGAKTTPASEPDPLEEALEDLVRAAQEDLEVSRRPAMRESRIDAGELTEGPESLSFVLLAPGYRSWEFRVGVAEGELRVEGPDFFLTKPLHSKVDSASLRTRYNNGVLSVRLAKKF